MNFKNIFKLLLGVFVYFHCSSSFCLDDPSELSDIQLQTKSEYNNLNYNQHLKLLYDYYENEIYKE